MNAADFTARWRQSAGAERANYQLFLAELCDVLGVPKPEPSVADNARNAYVFERSVTRTADDGTTSTNFIDLYKRGCFVLETKQGVDREVAEELALSAAGRDRAAAQKKGHGVRNTPGMNTVMIRAKQQAERYARLLPAEEGRPPFLLVVDVGATIEVYAEFTRTGGVYTPFPDPNSHRIALDRLGDPAVRERLRLIWTDPLELDPARRSARVTREIAAALAKLAQRLEAAGHKPADVAQFLMRCLFTMFAEDVRLLPANSFLNLLAGLKTPRNFRPMVEALWATMNTGGFSPILQEKLLCFNGGLFAEPRAIDLTDDQLALLKEAASAKWAEVEPAIFGTLLERALDPIERHKLGAHYTPRAYVERLVVPTVMEPLRADWEAVQAAAVRLAEDGDHTKAAAEVEAFHARLCQVRVLDPACGSGNFLYVALELMKRLEGEVLDFLGRLQGAEQTRLQAATVTVDPHQFLGIEVNPRAAAIAELVLWIGYLQWHFRTHGEVMPPEPVIRNFKNIENRDAVLAWDRVEPLLDDAGQPVTRWDGRSMKPSPVTGEDIPDESKRVPVLKYINPRKAQWPEAEFIVGNPPFIGSKRMREALGDAYVDALQEAWPEIPQATDLVIRWWHAAALLVKKHKALRFGFITTNSISQPYVRRAVEPHLQGVDRVSIVHAIPDHPWVDSADGAAVRIAMTSVVAGTVAGVVKHVTQEVKHASEDTEDLAATFEEEHGLINSNLSIGPDVTKALDLEANQRLCSVGMKTIGAAFQLDRDEAEALVGSSAAKRRVVRPYLNGRDFAQVERGTYVIDLYGLAEEEARKEFPDIYQHLLVHAKPERLLNRNKIFRDLWWVIGHPRPQFRIATLGLARYIATAETQKHRFLAFVPTEIVPDSTLVTFAFEDAYDLGVLSSVVHVEWATAAGTLLGPTPRYNKTVCFETFPFPDPPAALRQRIRDLGEQLDAHRKRQQALHPGLTLTGMYNVLEKLRAGQPLTAKEKAIHEQGLVSVLRQIHDDLDAAVLEAYGWGDLRALSGEAFTEELLARLVALNRERAEEEARGIVRWLRPEFQNAAARADRQGELDIEVEEADDTEAAPPGKKSAKKSGKKPSTSTKATKAAAAPSEWPAGLLAQTQAVRAVLQSARGPLTPEQVAARFARAKRARVEEILETLAALGQATRTKAGAFARG